MLQRLSEQNRHKVYALLLYQTVQNIETDVEVDWEKEEDNEEVGEYEKIVSSNSII